MVWLAFPIICLYFLIGSMLSDYFKEDLGEAELMSAMWYVFWPIMLGVTLFYLSICLVGALIWRFFYFIQKVYRYLKHERHGKYAS